jgi:hypothetical protein
VVSNWCAGNNKTEEWAGTVQIFEVTRDKKVIWALSSRLEPDGDREVHAGPLQLFGVLYRRSVHFDVLEQHRSDVRPHQQAGLGGLVEGAVLEDEIRQRQLTAVDINLPAVILERAVDESEIV